MTTLNPTAPEVPVALTPEDRARFRMIYNQLMKEKFGGRTPAKPDLLNFTAGLERAWQRGWAPVGKTYKQISLKSTTLPTQNARTTAVKPVAGSKSPKSLLVLIVVAVLAFAAIMIFGPALAHPNTAANVSATGTPGTPISAAIGEGEISIGQSTPTVLTPMTLRIGGRSFVVMPSGLDKNKNWSVSNDPRFASWLNGSLVNLTFFLSLETDPNAAEWMAQLRATQPHATLTIGSNTGVVTTRTFDIDQIRWIGRTDTDVYNSTALGLTILIRTGSADDRLYLHGQEVLPTALTTPKEVMPEPTAVPTQPPTPATTQRPAP